MIKKIYCEALILYPPIRAKQIKKVKRFNFVDGGYYKYTADSGLE
jgi:hypothetical protein